MVRFLNYGLSNKKKFYLAISCVFGIGLSRSKELCSKEGISLNSKVEEVERRKVNNVLRVLKRDNEVEEIFKKSLLEKYNKELHIKSYKGLRYSLRLPVNGQRTKTNGKTAKKQLGVKK